MEHPAYRDNLEQILAFTGGRQLLNLADIRKFTGMKDLRTIQRHFPLQKGGYISAATFARQLCGGKNEQLQQHRPQPSGPGNTPPSVTGHTGNMAVPN